MPVHVGRMRGLSEGHLPAGGEPRLVCNNMSICSNRMSGLLEAARVGSAQNLDRGCSARYLPGWGEVASSSKHTDTEVLAAQQSLRHIML